jgi:Ca-activated chloride channel family protein
MNLLRPWLLLIMVMIPLILVIYIWILRRKRKFAVRYSSLSLIREAIPKRSRWRQHLPFIFFLIGAASLITAMAGPAVAVEVPLSRTTIILALDVSRSMCATDVTPNRLTVAQDAMLKFIEDQVTGTQIGIVAFARLAEIIVPPTQDKEVLRMAVANLTTSLGTAIGSATLKSIDAISEINPGVAPSGINLGATDRGSEIEDPFYQPEIIVLLTDGANTHGPLPLDVAQNAADRQVRVYTIGFGTTEISEMVCSQQQLGSDAFGNDFGNGFFGGFGGGGRNFRRYLLLDEPTLKGVAEITGGSYFRAENSEQLFDVFLDLPNQIILQKENLEISVLFSTFGAIFFLLAVTLSLLWNRFP